MIMTIDDIPVSTAGVYNHVGLLDKEPRLKMYKNWLALVYTIPDKRHNGYGALICRQMQSHAKTIGIETLYLFTDTAENLYKRLGWEITERIATNGRNIAVMKMELQNGN